MLRKVSIYAALAAVIVFGFQNCGQVAFNGGSANGMLAVKGDGNSLASGNITQPGDGSITDPNDDSSSSSDDQGGDDQQAGDDQPSDTNNNEQITEPGDKAQGPQHFICVLEGPGQSQRLGFADEKLVEKTGALKDVCMSEYACEKIVSKAFKVKHPKFAGFCKHEHPEHHVQLSDKTLLKMIDEMLAK